MRKCHICDNPKVEELETVKFPDGVLEAYYCKPGCGCREAAQQTGAVDTPSALCPKCGLPLVAGLGCIDCD